jgi:hypothetical protein
MCGERAFAGPDSLLSAEEGEEQREQNAQNDRCRQRKIETEAAAAEIEIAREAAERHAEHHEQPESRDAETDQDQEPTHGIKVQTSKFKGKSEVQSPTSDFYLPTFRLLLRAG